MELCEKLQQLRKEHHLTQEQLAESLFVSRTAVSKWETGRGLPNMDSLQLIAKFYGVTLDDLLSAEDVIAVAETENRENLFRFAYGMDGLLNVAALLSSLLPLFKAERDGVFYAVPLYRFEGWLSVLYGMFLVAIAVCGCWELLLRKRDRDVLKRLVNAVGFALNVCAVLLFIISGQPYPAALFFVLLLIKWVVTQNVSRP